MRPTSLPPAAQPRSAACVAAARAGTAARAPAPARAGRAPRPGSGRPGGRRAATRCNVASGDLRSDAERFIEEVVAESARRADAAPPTGLEGSLAQLQAQAAALRAKVGRS